MNRSSLLIFMLLGLTSMTFGQRTSDREEVHLLGPVRTVAERTGITIARTDPRGTVPYDPQGNEIERVMISDFGELMGKQTQSFDARGVFL